MEGNGAGIYYILGIHLECKEPHDSEVHESYQTWRVDLGWGGTDRV